MLLGPAVKPKPENQPDKAQRSARHESAAPTEKTGGYRHNHRYQHVADIGSRVEEAGSGGALGLGEPFGYSLDTSGEVGRFSQPEQEHRDGQREDRTGRSRPHGRDAPQDDGYGESLARSQAVGKPSGDEESNC